MLGTRVLALVLFTRLYSFWVFAVAGKTRDHLLHVPSCWSAAGMLLVLEGFPASSRNGFAFLIPSPCRCPLAAHGLLAGGPADGHRGPALPLEAVQLRGGSRVHLLLR